MVPQMHPAQPPGLVEMRVGPFEQLAALAQQSLPTIAPNPPAVGIDRRLGRRLPCPLASSPIRLRHVTADTQLPERDHGLVTVIPLVADDLDNARPGRQDHLDVVGRGDERLDHRGRVPVVRVLHRHADDGPGLQIDGVLGGVRQMRPAVLHLRDLRVGIVRMRPVVVGPFLRALPVEPRQLRSGRGGDARRLREPGQPRLIGFARVPAHDGPHRGVRFKRRRVDPNRLPLYQVGVRQPLQDPREDCLVRLDVNQPARARQRRMVRRRLVQREVQEVPDTQRVRRTPRDRALRVQSLEVAEQQQPKVATRCQTRATHIVGIEFRALPLGEGVEPRLVEHAIQPLIKGMPGALREIRRRDPHGRLTFRFRFLPIAIGRV